MGSEQGVLADDVDQLHGESTLSVRGGPTSNHHRAAPTPSTCEYQSSDRIRALASARSALNPFDKDFRVKGSSSCPA